MAVLQRLIDRRGALAAGTALVLAVSACAGEGGGPGDEPGGGTVKIGFMGDLTGENAGIVKPLLAGAKLAIEEYNGKNPDTKIELVEYDSQAKEDQASSLTRKATAEDRIVGMIGPAFSGENKAAGPLLEKAKVPSVTIATNPDLAKNGWKYWHRVTANDADQGPAIARFLTEATNAKKAFVVSDEQEYGVGLAKSTATAFTEAGVDVTTDKIESEESDYSATVNKARAAQPDVIFYGGYYAQAGRLLKQLRDVGVDARFASGDGSLDPQLVSGAGAQNAEGAIIGCPCLIADPDAEGAVGEFAVRYKKATGSDPAIFATEGYDSATAFIKAVEAGNTTTAKINDFLATLEFEGVSKPLKFKENGEPEANSIFVYQVLNGEITALGPSEEAELP
jgi:branched-chain amino acid transport system substrate-binding protein